jgi:hypothetical protein
VSDRATLKDVMAELGVSYHQAWNAARKGRLPASQPLGPGTAWYVDPQFLAKSSRPADGNESEEIKHG